MCLMDALPLRVSLVPSAALVGVRAQARSCFQCPSEARSTLPWVTLMAVWSSIAYAGFEMPAGLCLGHRMPA